MAEEEEVEDILADIRSLLQKEREEKENEFYFTYPAQGGTKTITETLEINAYTGDAYADGTEEHLSDSLRVHNLKYARSLFITSNQEFKYQLDDGGKKTITTPASGRRKLLLTHQRFQRVLIEVSVATTIDFWCSTDADAELKIT